MRLINKFYALCALGLCGILSSAWLLTSGHYYRRVIHTDFELESESESGQKFRSTTPLDRRLVVFGDSWSDSNAAAIQGSVWTDHLCSELSCELDNFAQTAKSIRGNYIGSVVDNAELSSARILFGLYRSPVADFKRQAKQWLNAESETLQDFSDDAIRHRQNHTIFVVSFGVWDIWDLVGQDYKKATASADRSIEVLMGQLDMLSEGWDTNDFKVILTLTPDVTFLPAFKPTAKKYPEQYKDAVKLAQYWNDKLRAAAKQWKFGTIHLFDTNEFMVGLIRDQQLAEVGVEDKDDGQEDDALWENVHDPCVTTRQQWVTTSEEECRNPEKYLFW